jgi:hypothetical protein
MLKGYFQHEYNNISKYSDKLKRGIDFKWLKLKSCRFHLEKIRFERFASSNSKVA